MLYYTCLPFYLTRRWLALWTSSCFSLDCLGGRRWLLRGMEIIFIAGCLNAGYILIFDMGETVTNRERIISGLCCPLRLLRACPRRLHAAHHHTHRTPHPRTRAHTHTAHLHTYARCILPSYAEGRRKKKAKKKKERDGS